MSALWRQATVVFQAANLTLLLQVLSLFQDNFDYGDIRRDFVHGVLTSDLLMKNIYCYVAKDGYAARVQDTRSYDAIRFVSTTFVTI
jgi:translation initiation factor eIF-2B subunit epsilon